MPSFRKAAERWRSWFSQRGKRPLFRRRYRADPFLDNLRLSSRVLWAALFLLGVYIAVDLALPEKNPPAGPAVAPVAVAGGEGLAAAQNELRPLSVYISAASSRNPFLPAGGAVAKAPTPAQGPNRLQELSQGLTVVGIDRGENPRALIEDTKQGRTYFVRTGDDIKGMKVERITDKGVTLSYEGKEVDLSY